MVQFQNNLESSRLPEWAPEYVNYSLLKLKLKDIIAVKDNAELEQVCQARKFIFQGMAPLPLLPCNNINLQSNFTRAESLLLYTDKPCSFYKCAKMRPLLFRDTGHRDRESAVILC